MMIASRAGALVVLISVASLPVFSQFPARNTDANARSAAAQDNRIAMQRRAYDTLVARGNERGAGVAAGQLALAYDQHSDYENAAICGALPMRRGTRKGFRSS